jgi:hypothetical protein
MSDSIAHKLWVIEEPLYGIPVTLDNMLGIRNTACSLALTKEGFESEEARADRAVSDFRHGNKSVSGDIGIEFSYESYDALLEGVFCGADWAPKMDRQNVLTISVNNMDGSFNDSANGFPLLYPGDVFTVSGFTTPANNGNFKVVTRTAAKLVVTKADGTAHGLAFEAAGDLVDMVSVSEHIKTGAVRRSYQFLRQFTDQLEAAEPFHMFNGVMINAFNLTVAPGGNVKGSFSLLGKNLVIDGTDPSGSVLGDVGTTRVFDSFTGSLYEGGALMANVTEIQFKLENGFEPQFVCFSDTTIDPSIGKSRVSGSIGVHFANSVMLKKFLNETPSSLVFTLTDLNGNSYTFRLPRIVYNGGQPDTAAQGSIILTMPFTALYDSTTGTQAILERIPA